MLKFLHFTMLNVSAILLAAGLSERMLGPNKLLLNLGQETIISRTYNALRLSQVNQIVVVTGRDEPSIKAAIMLKAEDQYAHNEVYQNGMTSSIQTGLEEIEESEALMVCLGDMPLLTSGDYDLLINAFRQDGAKDKILVPWFKDNRANPVIFGRDYFKEILSHQSPNGCSGIIKNHSQKVLNLQVDNERFIRDIDTADDFKQLETNAE